MFQFPGFALILLFDSENKSFIQKTENGEHKTDIAIHPLSSVLRLPEVGFPIRKFPDQSLFAAPRDLSQRTTSFIASQRQGIHRTPFWHLIMLEIRKRTPGIPFTPPTPVSSDSKRPVLLQTHPGSLRSGSDHDWCYRRTEDREQRTEGICRPWSDVRHPKPDALPLHDVNVSEDG
jgi:hypothetical protein